MIQKKSKKLIAGVLAATLVCNMPGVYSFESIKAAAKGYEDKIGTESDSQILMSTAEVEEEKDTENEDDTNAQEAKFKKDENVYGTLKSDGEVDNVYVINQFNVTKAGKITDYGDYDTVENLTTLENIKKDDNTYTLNATEGNFYYQGNISECELPWDIGISYYLDGKEISAEKLAGENGELVIKLKVNDKKDVDQTFFENYMLQISLTLDNSKTDNIKSKDATMADAGAEKKVSFTVMPDTEEEYELSMDINDFEMDGIQIAGIPFSMNVEFPSTDNMTSGLVSLSDGIDKLSDSATSINDGLAKLVSGVDRLSSGVSDYSDGIEKYVNGIKKIDKGSESFKNGLDDLSEGADKLASSSTDIGTGLSGADKLLNSIDTTGMSADQIKAVKTAAATLDALNEGYGSFSHGLTSYAQGVDKAAKGYASLQSGLDTLADNGKKLDSGSKKLADGISSLNTGTSKLSDGMDKYTDGMNKLNDKTVDIPQKMDKKIKKMKDTYKYDFTATSFTSKKNDNNIDKVQFVLSTPSIKKPDKVKKEEENKKQDFISRLKALFS